LPPLLRGLMQGERWIEAEGDTIGAALADFGKRNPAIALHIFDEQGTFRHNIVFIHNGEIIRAKKAAAHVLKPGDEVILTTALAGG